MSTEELRIYCLNGVRGEKRPIRQGIRSKEEEEKAADSTISGLRWKL